MILYHHTAVALAESILANGLTLGYLARKDGSGQHNVVWLTSDPAHEGHGLPTGKEVLTASKREYMARVQLKPVLNDVVYDKTRIRLSVDLSDRDPALVPFVSWARQHEDMQYARRMGLSAVMDLSKVKGNVTSLALRTRTKEKTWWLYFGAIGPQRIVAADFRTTSAYQPYDFEAHGRSAMHDAGQVVVSPATLAELQTYFEPQHALDRVKAFAICVRPDETPSIQIRGDGVHLIFRIGSADLIYGTTPPNIDRLRAWIHRHAVELTRCWGDAMEVYFRYYPQATPVV